MSQPAKPTPESGATSRSSALALGAAILLGSGFLRQALAIATLLVTAKLLTPEDFGVIAYVFVGTALLEMMSRQLSMVLVRLDTVTSDHLNTVFTFQIILGLAAAGIFLSARPLVAMLRIPELVQILPVLSAFAVLIALRSPKFQLYERALRFAPAAAEETLNRVVYSAAAVFLAWLWRDFWAIVAAFFLGQAIRSIFTFAAAPMWPRLSLATWRDSLSFSSWTIGAQLSQFLANSMPQLFIGATLGLADAGIYRLGSRITGMVTTQFFAPVQRIIYPGLADVSRSTGRQREAFARVNAVLLAIVLPVSIGTALIAGDAILLGLSVKWVAAAQVIWVLAPLKALETLQANVRAASYVEGSTRILFFRNAVLLACVTLYMWVGTRFGFYGALAAAGLSSLTALAITLMLARRFGNSGFFEPLTVAWRSFAACGIMAVVILGADWIPGAGPNPLDPAFTLSAKIVLGIFSYSATHFALWAVAGRPEGFESLILSLMSRAKNRLRRPPA